MASRGEAARAASQRAQRTTPLKVQMRQRNVPQSTQGYPSEARSSRPQERQFMASCSLISTIAHTGIEYRLILLMRVAREIPSSTAARVRLPA